MFYVCVLVGWLRVCGVGGPQSIYLSICESALDVLVCVHIICKVVTLVAIHNVCVLFAKSLPSLKSTMCVCVCVWYVRVFALHMHIL